MFFILLAGTQNTNNTLMEIPAIESVNVTALMNKICVVDNSSSTQSWVIVYHKCSDENVIPLSIGYTSQNNEHQASAACFEVSPGCYWAAVFGKEANGRMGERPVKVQMLQIKGK